MKILGTRLLSCCCNVEEQHVTQPTRLYTFVGMRVTTYGGQLLCIKWWSVSTLLRNGGISPEVGVFGWKKSFGIFSLISFSSYGGRFLYSVGGSGVVCDDSAGAHVYGGVLNGVLFAPSTASFCALQPNDLITFGWAAWRRPSRRRYRAARCWCGVAVDKSGDDDYCVAVVVVPCLITRYLSSSLSSLLIAWFMDCYCASML